MGFLRAGVIKDGWNSPIAFGTTTDAGDRKKHCPADGPSLLHFALGFLAMTVRRAPSRIQVQAATIADQVERCRRRWLPSRAEAVHRVFQKCRYRSISTIWRQQPHAERLCDARCQSPCRLRQARRQRSSSLRSGSAVHAAVST